jgi:hypothetical protein
MKDPALVVPSDPEILAGLLVFVGERMPRRIQLDHAGRPTVRLL